MKDTTNRSTRAFARAIVTASAGTLILISQTSCGSGGGKGMLSNPFKKGSDENGSLIAEEKPKKKRGSIFNRAKERNSFIDDGIQTTRRDRFAAQAANSDFSLPTDPDPAEMMDPTPRTPAAPVSPNAGLPLDPAPVLPTAPRTASNTRSSGDLGLPSLDTDFPQPKLPSDIGSPAPPAAPAPAPAPTPERDEDGYIPLQPKLPGLETIIPPSE